MAASVWKTFLEGTEIYSQSRLAVAENYEQQFETTKNLKNNKTHVIKKVTRLGIREVEKHLYSKMVCPSAAPSIGPSVRR